MNKLALAGMNLIIGTIIGLLFLETLLQVNPALLLRGMGLPAPVDAQLSTQDYRVRLSDADVFYWQSDQIRPIPEIEDKVEAQVHFQTDEFGFPNAAPLPPTADVVVLGRSYSLGAQASDPWPRRLAELTGFKVLNLSQSGSSLPIKLDYLVKFGLLRRPRWVVIEVLPSMDILDFRPASPTILQDLPFPLIQQIGRKIGLAGRISSPSMPIYPLSVHIPDRSVNLTFFSYYLSALTVDSSSLAASQQWKGFSQGLLTLFQEARANHACVALLYAPTNVDIFFPLALQPEELEPSLRGLAPWKLNQEMSLVQDGNQATDIRSMQANAHAARDLVAEIASRAGVVFIDPIPSMTQTVLAGDDPFMAYDTHWSAAGHQLVAKLVADALQEEECP